jgi:hypothetical protein
MSANLSQLSDPVLAPFLQPTFDPVSFLNSTLPALQTTQKPQPNAASLANLSSETQSLLATVNAQAARLTALLTQMTDDIIRSGSRLAYQVDVLRGEALALKESLTERVADDVRVFVPNGKYNDEPASANQSSLAESQEPIAIERLRMLLSVRDRLDSVIKLFGAALAWPSPPASGGATSFISVSSTQSRDADAKAAAWLTAQKNELSGLVAERRDEEAQKRVDDLQELSGIWRSAAEERARMGVVVELEKWVDSEVRRRDGIEDREDEGQRVFFDGIYT